MHQTDASVHPMRVLAPCSRLVYSQTRVYQCFVLKVIFIVSLEALPGPFCVAGMVPR